MPTTSEDLTRVYSSEDKVWIKINHMPDGSERPFDMAFFQTLETVRTADDVQALLAQLAG